MEDNVKQDGCGPANVLRMPARQRHDVDDSNAATGEPASVELLPGVLPANPALITQMGEDEVRFYCSILLMEISGDSDKISSLFHALPADLGARALIELVLSTALMEDELRPILYRLMTDLSPERRRPVVYYPYHYDDDDETDYDDLA